MSDRPIYAAEVRLESSCQALELVDDRYWLQQSRFRLHWWTCRLRNEVDLVAHPSQAVWQQQ